MNHFHSLKDTKLSSENLHMEDDLLSTQFLLELGPIEYSELVTADLVSTLQADCTDSHGIADWDGIDTKIVSQPSKRLSRGINIDRSMLNIVRMPFDVLFEISLYLDIEDVVNLSNASRQLRFLLCEETLCRYIIELNCADSFEAKLAKEGKIHYREACRLIYKEKNKSLQSWRALELLWNSSPDVAETDVSATLVRGGNIPIPEAPEQAWCAYETVWDNFPDVDDINCAEIWADWTSGSGVDLAPPGEHCAQDNNWDDVPDMPNLDFEQAWGDWKGMQAVDENVFPRASDLPYNVSSLPEPANPSDMFISDFDILLHDWFGDGQLRTTKTSRNEQTTCQQRNNNGTFCGKTFNRPCDLRRHSQNVHARRFKCTNCSYTCNHPKDLKRHEKTHTGDRPFKCPVQECQRRFARLDNLHRHMRKAHPTVNGTLSTRFVSVHNSRVYNVDMWFYRRKNRRWSTKISIRLVTQR